MARAREREGERERPRATAARARTRSAASGSRDDGDDDARFEALVEQLLAVWRRHQDILLLLLDAIPPAGLLALPAGSRGRDVARQFAHVYRVRLAWLRYHLKGVRETIPRFDKGAPLSKAELRTMLRESGTEVEAFLGQALRGTARVRMFGGQPARWLAYLIAHESHHRGQIMLALKQSAFRLPERIAIQGLWGRWIFGK